jgi:hypothetical protein
MDIDHEAHKHGVPKSTVKGEAERAAAEDPGEQTQNALDDAKETLEDASGPDRDDEDPDKDADAKKRTRSAADRRCAEERSG